MSFKLNKICFAAFLAAAFTIPSVTTGPTTVCASEGEGTVAEVMDSKVAAFCGHVTFAAQKATDWLEDWNEATGQNHGLIFSVDEADNKVQIMKILSNQESFPEERRSFWRFMQEYPHTLTLIQRFIHNSCDDQHFARDIVRACAEWEGGETKFAPHYGYFLDSYQDRAGIRYMVYTLLKENVVGVNAEPFVSPVLDWYADPSKLEKVQQRLTQYTGDESLQVAIQSLKESFSSSAARDMQGQEGQTQHFRPGGMGSKSLNVQNTKKAQQHFGEDESKSLSETTEINLKDIEAFGIGVAKHVKLLQKKVELQIQEYKDELKDLNGDQIQSLTNYNKLKIDLAFERSTQEELRKSLEQYKKKQKELELEIADLKAKLPEFQNTQENNGGGGGSSGESQQDTDEKETQKKTKNQQTSSDNENE